MLLCAAAKCINFTGNIFDSIFCPFHLLLVAFDHEVLFDEQQGILEAKEQRSSTAGGRGMKKTAHTSRQISWWTIAREWQ